MKERSVKVKITLLLTILMTMLAALMIVFMLIFSNRVAMQTARKQLTDTLRTNLNYVELTEHRPSIQEGFSYAHNGIVSLIYNQNKALIAGQIPVGFQGEVPFENGVIQTVDAGDTKYLVLDMWIADGWEQGVWMRGLMEAPNHAVLTRNLLTVAGLTLPLFVLLVSLGSYHIMKQTFRPLDKITAAAEAIQEAKDLSGRIGITDGKDEFSRLAENFDRMFERLEHSFETEKQFTSDASHELRTPISIIKGACEYAMKYDETPEERAETIDMIHRQADKMAGLVSQLLSMTRMEQGVEKIKMETIALGDFLRNFSAEQHWKEEEIVIHAAESCLVEGNAELLGRLLQNLVENAVKYSPKQETVYIFLEDTKEEIRLSVKDRGIGIAKEEQEKIWKRFYQVDSSRSSDEGAGLGLSMVKQIAKLHGGSMSVESSPGEGSTFTLHLPRKNKF